MILRESSRLNVHLFCIIYRREKTSLTISDNDKDDKKAVGYDNKAFNTDNENVGEKTVGCDNTTFQTESERL